jgi:hypothetical protein
VGWKLGGNGAHREVEPIWVEGVGGVAQHAAHASGVLPRGVEVGVIAYCRREVHLDTVSFVQSDFAQLGVGPQGVRPPASQQVDHTIPGCGPYSARARHKTVECWLAECAVRIKSRNI